MRLSSVKSDSGTLETEEAAEGAAARKAEADEAAEAEAEASACGGDPSAK